jgi:type VI secretion system Hcp family effector
MRTTHPSILTFLCLAFALTVGTFARAQDRSELNISNSIVEASSVMQITRSNIGQYTNGSITLTKKVDAASPQLLQAHTTNAVIPRLSLTLYKPGDHSKSKVITLENVKIASFSGGQATPVQNSKGTKAKGNATSEPSTSGNETFSFTFQKISVVYYSGGNVSTSDDWNSTSN